VRTFLPLLLAALLLLIPTADAYAAPAIQQESASRYEGIVVTTANIRSGPGLQYEVVDQAQSGESLTVVACNEDCTWLQLEDGNWIAAFLVDLAGASTTSPTTPSGESTRGRLFDPDDVELNQPSPAALEIVSQILSYTGLPQSFDLYSANIYNAAALMSNGERVILYDPQLIADIEDVTGHDWPAVSILAHEIGHHLAGHTLAAAYNRDFELEADYFSGFILQKMGSTLAEAQAVMNLLRDHPNMTDHPPQAERLAAIEQGWQEASRQNVLTTWQPNFSAFADEAAIGAEGNATVRNSAIGNVTLLDLLRQTHSRAMMTEEQGAAFVEREWSLGLAAFAP
jgi:hypothetical protein